MCGMKTGRLKIIYNEQVYYVFVIAGQDLSREQSKDYQVFKNSFLIYLFTGNILKSFQLQYGNNGKWYTEFHSMLIPEEIPIVIGHCIESNKVK